MSVLTKKCQDINVSLFFDQCCILWVSADDVLNLLRLPHAVLQTVQPRHKKCWVDFRCSHHCSHDPNKIFIDLYGLGNLCNRVNSPVADYLMTLFVSEAYSENARGNRRSPSPRRSPSRCRSPSPRRRSRSRCRPVSPRRRSRSRSRSPRRRSPSPRRRSRSPRCCPQPRCCWHHKHHTGLLERVARQNDLLLTNLNQLSTTNANQHLELSNVLNAIRLQSVTTAAQVGQILETVQGLGEFDGDFTKLLAEIDARLAAQSSALQAALNQLAEQVRNDLSGITAILNNLTSSVTNINATLNNLLQAVNGLNLGGIIGELQETINTILDLLQTILNILQPLNKK
ncbi:CALYX/PEP [Agrotis segetum nucleopolyhedrovirus A]|uniref:CALYX/PEP n=1 Tax=Agrotis segetum nuclear polyhedrosis virus TaxID=1962501 RepID=Q287M3_NPVAS|nr:CALYX/PEP [Agrotis segetum nucleopolyhedrovirus A]AAZ38215.1 CALYX/PEP [Agrotis segetum nucleopolyhedrovirus A]